MAKPFKIILLAAVAAVVIGGVLWFAYLRSANGPTVPMEQPAAQNSEQETVSENGAETEENKNGEIEWSGDEIGDELDLLEEVSE